MSNESERFPHPDRFVNRHNGPDDADVADTVKLLGVASLDALIDETVPKSIRLGRALNLPAALNEHQLLDQIRAIADQNRITKTFIGMGYSDTVTPSVILRGVFENPAWYTAYTPYQAEISQGRLEALLNFQTMVSELAGLEIANASLLDEGTAAAEAMSMIERVRGEDAPHTFFVGSDVHPQTLDVVRGRAAPLGFEIITGDPATFDWKSKPLAGALVQSPATDGRIHDVKAIADALHATGALLVVATDLLACTLMTPPGEQGADVVVGSAQRFG